MIKGECKASFGTGDVMVSIAVPEAEHGENGYLILQNIPDGLEPQPIGSNCNGVVDQRINPNADTVFQFTNIDSLDVVLGALITLRKRMETKDTHKLNGKMLDRLYGFNPDASIKEIIKALNEDTEEEA